MEFKMITRYKDGSRVKHLANRSVVVATNKNKIGGVIIELRRADLPKEEVGKNPILYKTMKGKIELTGMCISREAAFALYIQLNDYFTRVDPEMEIPSAEKSAEIKNGLDNY